MGSNQLFKYEADETHHCPLAFKHMHITEASDGGSRRGLSKSESQPQWQQGFRMHGRMAWVGRELKAPPVPGPHPMNAILATASFLLSVNFITFQVFKITSSIYHLALVLCSLLNTEGINFICCSNFSANLVHFQISSSILRHTAVRAVRAGISHSSSPAPAL